MTHPLSRVALAFTVVLCACAGPRTPPEHDSPQPIPVRSDLTVWAVDRLRPEPTWYDPGRDRVVWLRDGAIEVVADVGVQALIQTPTALRVFDDGSFVVQDDLDPAVIFPAGGTPHGMDAGALGPLAIDGTSVDDFWYLFWSASDFSDESDRLCHHLSTVATDACVPVPNLGGYSRQLVMASDGSLYVGESDGNPYRYAGGKLEAVDGWAQSPIHAFRRTGSSVFALADDQSAYLIDGLHATEVHSPSVLDVVGSADDYFYATYDQESAKVDPNCGGLFADCQYQTLWTQAVYWRVTNGSTTELAHETCDPASSCDPFVSLLGVENGQLYAVGSAVLRIPLP